MIFRDFPSPHCGIRTTALSSTVQILHPPLLDESIRSPDLSDDEMKSQLRAFCYEGSPSHLVSVGKQLSWEFVRAMDLVQQLGIHALNFETSELVRIASGPAYVDVNMGYVTRAKGIEEPSLPKSSPREKIVVDVEQEGLEPYSGSCPALLLEVLRRQIKAVAHSVTSRRSTRYYVENGLYLSVRGGSSARVAIAGAWSTYVVDK